MPKGKQSANTGVSPTKKVIDDLKSNNPDMANVSLPSLFFMIFNLKWIVGSIHEPKKCWTRPVWGKHDTSDSQSGPIPCSENGPQLQQQAIPGQTHSCKDKVSSQTIISVQIQAGVGCLHLRIVWSFLGTSIATVADVTVSRPRSSLNGWK